MKIPINLASQPFRRDRAMLAASIGVSLLLVGTLGVLISLALADRTQLADLRHDVDRMESEDSQGPPRNRRGWTPCCASPENAEVLERSVFLNALLLRKGISWTRIFADLEKVLPYNVRVIQIHPTVDSLNQVSLDMQLGAESPVPVIELLKSMASPPFSNPDGASSRLLPSRSRCGATA